MNVPNCEICGEPMPEGETMFKYHGYSGPCPKPPLPKDGPFGEPTGERGESVIIEAEKLTGVLRVGAVTFNAGVPLRVVQGAIDRLAAHDRPITIFTGDPDE